MPPRPNGRSRLGPDMPLRISEKDEHQARILEFYVAGVSKVFFSPMEDGAITATLSLAYPGRHTAL